jgi:cell division septal protein FtsQ
LNEKNFQAIVLFNGGQYLTDENLNIVPLMPSTNNIDLPIVENVKGLTPHNCKRNPELKKALKIIFAAKFLDESLFNAISEVDMNNGKEITIRFANDDYSLLLGRKNEIRKIAYFDVLFENLNKVKSKGMLEYIDLRFKDEICLGFRDAASSGTKRKI